MEPCGEEEVYDVQIDRTENFIANGLVSHNTRWHEDDLVGGILAEEDKRPEAERLWHTVNIPAIAEEGVPDALQREPGVALESARGRTLADFRRIRGSVGARVWSSLYQGCPTPSEGGLFSREEIDRGRVPDADLAGLIVSVDPAESGRGDEAGVLVMGWDHMGSVYVAEDHSARMTSDLWARTAVRAALRTGAGEIVYEAFTAAETYRNVLESTWQDIARQAALLRAHDNDVLVAAELWHAEGHEGDSLGPMQDTLELLDRIPDGREAPYRLVPWRKRGDKVARAAGARQSVTTGRLRMIGTHPVLERQMCFVGDTMIATPDGERRIDSLYPGDTVLTSKGARAVLHSWDNGVRDTVLVKFEGGQVECTPGHRFWSPSAGRWVAAADLMAGSTIELCGDLHNSSEGAHIDSGKTTATTSAKSATACLGTTRKNGAQSTYVLSVEPTGKQARVYDLTVDEVHEYYAGGVLAHNCTWQVGQGSPDRVDAMVNGHDHIMSVISQPVSIALPQEW